MSTNNAPEQQNLSDRTEGNGGNEVRIGRRRFSSSFKQKILAEIAACKRGELGLLLRREGLYHSQIDAWRKQARSDANDKVLDQKRGRKAKSVSLLQPEVDRLAREVARLTGQLKQAQAVIEVQKKVSEMLSLMQPHESA